MGVIRSRKLMYVCIALFCLVIVTTHLSSGILARYTTEKGGDDSANVARFVFDTQGVSAAELDISSIKKPGDNIEYTFKVCNKDGVNVCEIAQEYTVNVTVYGNMPFVCTLTDGSNIASLDNTPPILTYSASLTGELAAGVEEEDTFTLRVEWPSDENGAQYANGMAIGKVTITVTSVQKD
ncbi:MAG: hypothetical protein IJ445_03770 [Clostridia bacterium]|nr:hypothetical protein [Clostridia bacterium]